MRKQHLFLYTLSGRMCYRFLHSVLQEAKKLLGSGEFSVEEAALAAGFSNVPFFCRSYKNHFGHSPGKDT